MHYLHSQGSPGVRGEAHGRQVGEKIAWLVDYYRSGFKDPSGAWREGLDPDSRKRAMARRAEQLWGLYPEGCEEIEGIARGAGLPFEDVFELNIVFDLGRPAGAACSVYGFQGRDGGVLLGKTDDHGVER